MNVDDRTALELLKVFARLEFALKQFPEFVQGNAGRNAATQWSAYSHCLRNEDFLARIPSASRAVLLGNSEDGPPPMKMTLDPNRRVEFRDHPLEGEHVSDRLMDAARRVRNNLVHGGKERGMYERHRGHDQRVSEAAIDAMRSAMQAHDGVWGFCERV